MGNAGLQGLDCPSKDKTVYAKAWQNVGRKGDLAAAYISNNRKRKNKGPIFSQVSLRQFYRACKAGDLVLIREEVQIIPNVFVPPSVAREVVSSTTSGNFGGQKESALPMWNRGGIICLHNDAKALIEGTSTGIEIRPLKDVLKALRQTKAISAVRSLCSPNKPFYAAQLQPIIDFCTEEKGVVWQTILVNKRQAALLQQQQATAVTEAAEGKEPVAVAVAEVLEKSLPTEINSASDFSTLLLHGVKKQVLAVHPSMEYEALRVFYQLDTSGQGELNLDNCMKAVEMLASNGSNKQSSQIDAGKTAKYLQERALPLLERAAKTKKGGDGSAQKQKTLNVEEEQKVITFEDFLQVYRTLPLLHVPIQHDIQGILSGQIITAVYRFLKVLDNTAQDWATLTVSSYSSLNFDKVILHTDHILEKEVVCKIKPVES